MPLDGYPPEEFLRVLQVDLIGVWHCMWRMARRMTARGARRATGDQIRSNDRARNTASSRDPAPSLR